MSILSELSNHINTVPSQAEHYQDYLKVSYLTEYVFRFIRIMSSTIDDLVMD